MSYIFDLSKALAGFCIAILYVFICLIIIIWDYARNAMNHLIQKLTRGFLKHG